MSTEIGTAEYVNPGSPYDGQRCEIWRGEDGDLYVCFDDGGSEEITSPDTELTDLDIRNGENL